MQVLWTFSVYLESVAILPQLNLSSKVTIITIIIIIVIIIVIIMFIIVILMLIIIIIIINLKDYQQRRLTFETLT